MDDPKSVVSPGGVGFDINCGVRLLRTNLQEKDVLPVKVSMLLDFTHTFLFFFHVCICTVHLVGLQTCIPIISKTCACALYWISCTNSIPVSSL